MSKYDDLLSSMRSGIATINANVGALQKILLDAHDGMSSEEFRSFLEKTREETGLPIDGDGNIDWRGFPRR